MLLQIISAITLSTCLCISSASAVTEPDKKQGTLSPSLAGSPPQTENSSSLANILAPTKDNTPLKMYQQALNYLLGRNGVEKSTEKAAELFNILAEQNWSSAQLMLGNMYFSGRGVEKSDLLAYKWLSLASRNNMQLAQTIQNKRKMLYEKLQANLSDQSLNKIELSINEWSPSNTGAQLN